MPMSKEEQDARERESLKRIERADTIEHEQVTPLYCLYAWLKEDETRLVKITEIFWAQDDGSYPRLTYLCVLVDQEETYQSCSALYATREAAIADALTHVTFAKKQGDTNGLPA
jgi:hypothetical protein